MAKFIVRVIDNDTGDEEILGMTYPNQQAAEKAAEEYNKKGYWAAVYQEMKRFKLLLAAKEIEIHSLTTLNMLVRFGVIQMQQQNKFVEVLQLHLQLH